MNITLWLIAEISLTWFMSYMRASLSTFTFAFITLLAISTFFNTISFVSWLLFVVIALPLNIDIIRLQFISMPFIKVI